MPVKHPKLISPNYRLPVLKTRKNDLKKRWYIEYSVTNSTTKRLIRQVRYCPMRYRTASERRLWSVHEIANITRVLTDGYFVKATTQLSAPAPVVLISAEPPLTVVQALKKMVDLKFSAHRHRTATTYRNAQYRMAEFLRHIGQPDMLLTDIRQKHIYELSDYTVQTKGRSTNYRNGILDHLKALFTQLVKREYMTTNPVTGVEALPQKITRRNIAYTTEQREILEDYLLQQAPRLYAFTRFIYQAFIRPQELVRLQVRDIEFEHNRIAVHGSVAKATRADTKTEYVQITPALREIIADLRLYTLKPTDYLFSHGLRPGPHPIHRNVATNRHKKALQATGLYNEELTQYSWKHTGVMNAYRAGNDLAWLQNQLRHTDLKQTCTYLKSLGLMLHQRTDIQTW